MNLVIPAVHKDSYEIEVFRSSEAFLDPQKDYLLQQIAKATAAAPCYFPAVDVVNLPGDSRVSFIDGGLGKNDPSSFVMQDLVMQSNNDSLLGNKENNFCLLSFGCGMSTEESKMSNKAGLSDISAVINKMLCTLYHL